MTKPRNSYNALGSRRVRPVSPPGHTPAQQQFKEDCDINTIMARFQKTGAIDHVSRYQPEYGFATPQQFHEAMNIVAYGQSMFNDLPSSVRDEFSNDPEAFLEFVQDPANAEKAKELGIALSPEAAVLAASEPPGAAKTGEDAGNAVKDDGEPAVDTDPPTA